MPKLWFEGQVDFESSDAGVVLCARVAESPERQRGPFTYVDLCFVDQPDDPKAEPKHLQAELFRGKRVLITVEVIGE